MYKAQASSIQSKVQRTSGDNDESSSDVKVMSGVIYSVMSGVIYSCETRFVFQLRLRGS